MPPLGIVNNGYYHVTNHLKNGSARKHPPETGDGTPVPVGFERLAFEGPNIPAVDVVNVAGHALTPFCRRGSNDLMHEFLVIFFVFFVSVSKLV